MVSEIAQLMKRWAIVSLFDDRSTADTGPWAVVGDAAAFERAASDGDDVFVAIGDNAARADWIARLLARGAGLVTLVHPNAVVSSFATLGPGCMVAAGAVINAGARLGSGCIVNTSSSVDHDCVLGSTVHVSPGAHLGGGVHVGDRAWVGIGAAIRHGIQIGHDAVVGAGAAVVKDVPGAHVVAGTPAARLKGVDA